MQLYADTVYNKSAPMKNIIGFIDGSQRPFCRPTREQKACYNGHKRNHGIKVFHNHVTTVVHFSLDVDEIILNVE